MITTRRLPHAKENYDRIGGKSPLMDHTRRLCAKLETLLPDTMVSCIMRYTPPRADDVLGELKEKGIERLVLLPLYPQYSTTTTRSSLEDVEAALARLDYHPECISVERFYDHPDYVAAVAETVTRALGETDAASFHLLFSAHGLPQKIVDRGDPYEREVIASTKAVTEYLKSTGHVFKAEHLAYQSKVGPMKWLEPSLDTTLASLKGEKVLIVPIAFTIDNSETDFELAIEYREIADEMGIADYRVCRCPNDNDRFVRALATIFKESLA